jgi:hypothetical protein
MNRTLIRCPHEGCRTSVCFNTPAEADKALAEHIATKHGEEES